MMSGTNNDNKDHPVAAIAVNRSVVEQQGQLADYGDF